MERESFVFYKSFRRGTKHLPKDNQRNALVMMIEYWIDWIEPNPETDQIAYAMFLMAKPQIDKNNQRFTNWQWWWRPNKDWENSQKPNNNQTITKPKPNVNVNVNVNANVNNNKKEKKIVASFEEFNTKLEWVDRAVDFPQKNIEIEKQRCWAKLEWKIKNSKSTFRNRLLPHKRDKEYIDWIVEKTDDQRISEFLNWKNKFNDKYWFDKYQEVKDLWIKKCLAQPLSL